MATAGEVTIKVRIEAVELVKNTSKRKWQFWKKSIIEKPISFFEITGNKPVQYGPDIGADVEMLFCEGQNE